MRTTKHCKNMVNGVFAHSDLFENMKMLRHVYGQEQCETSDFIKYLHNCVKYGCKVYKLKSWDTHMLNDYATNINAPGFIEMKLLSVRVIDTIIHIRFRMPNNAFFIPNLEVQALCDKTMFKRLVGVPTIEDYLRTQHQPYDWFHSDLVEIYKSYNNTKFIGNYLVDY
jgi:hypothetical protein